MTHQTLSEVWFILWGLLWAIYLTLEGYTAGTGIILPFLAKKEEEELQVKGTIGPFWDGNEVWLVVAGGVTFAAFPRTYSLLFSSFYIPFYLVLFALFFRATGIEFMHKVKSPLWKKVWRWILFSGSLLIPILFGAAFSALYAGLPMDDTGPHVTLGDVINGYGILGGITFAVLFIFSGALWLIIKTIGIVQQRAMRLAKILWFVAVLAVTMFLIATTNVTFLFDHFDENPWLWAVPSLVLLIVLLSGLPILLKKWGWAFTLGSFTIFSLLATGFTGMFPDMLTSKVAPGYSLTLYNASGSQLNLTIMLWVTALILPLVIAYKIWIYRIFKDEIIQKP